MTPNRSLAISTEIQEIKSYDITGLLSEFYPKDFSASDFVQPGRDGVVKKKRSRIFTDDKTLQTMVFTAVQQDKSLENSVDLFYRLHQEEREQFRESEIKRLEQLKIDDALRPKTVGHPKSYCVRMPKSLEKDISSNTANYSIARSRLPLEAVQELFKQSRIPDAVNNYSHWNGLRVLATDGTYLQLQDTESIRQKFDLKNNGESTSGYPQALLEGIVDRGTGQIYNYKLASRHTSELPLCYGMLDSLPEKSILLADDLYNCYEILAKCCRLDIKIVVPAKRYRSYTVIKETAPGDEIIEIKVPKERSAWNDNPEPARLLTLRRIQCVSPEGGDYVLMTNVLDETIGKAEIQQLYFSRWDIEITIREIKTIMDINIVRSKSPDMIEKEVAASLAAYNLIRQIIYVSIKDLPFSPEGDFIYKMYTHNKSILIDKKGRVYDRWSTGRRRTQKPDTQE